MKKTLLLTAVLAGTLASTQAQTFSNAGFETWQGPSGVYQIENPGSWFGSDKLITDYALFLIPLGATPAKQLYKTSDRHSGESAAELRTKFLGDTLGNIPCALINAQVSIDIGAVMANPDLSNILNLFIYTGGTPILRRKLETISAWVKLTDQNNDNASVVITALQKAKTPGGADTMIAIGGGSQIIANNVSNNYREITVPVVYANPNNTATDTMIVVFSSSAVVTTGDISTDGNTLLVDDVSMTTSEGTSLSIRQPVFAEDIALVYPNPAKNLIYFNLNTFQKAEDYRLTVTDASGRVILMENLKQQVNEKNVSGWAKGNYFYSLINTKNDKHVNGKFSVE
jgi:hypothetical protein